MCSPILEHLVYRLHESEQHRGRRAPLFARRDPHRSWHAGERDRKHLYQTCLFAAVLSSPPPSSARCETLVNTVFISRTFLGTFIGMFSFIVTLLYNVVSFILTSMDLPHSDFNFLVSFGVPILTSVNNSQISSY